MTTATIQTNTIYGLGEGDNVANTTMLAYALRWANASYREIFNRYQFKSLKKRAIFRTTNGQSTYQAPSGLSGFILVKDEKSDSIIDQITAEEFAGKVNTTDISDESFTSSFDVAVSLDNVGIIQYSETVTNTAGTTTYTRDTDYTMNYATGTITVDSTGTMSDATEYYIDYQYYATGTPTKWCLEYDTTNARFIMRFDPVPNDTLIVSILYSAFPTDLSDSVDPVWDRFEFALERGAIYYGSLEGFGLPENKQEYRQNYEAAIQALLQIDMNMNPKHMQIPTKMKRNQYQSYERE